MNEQDVARLAAALATANGHPASSEWVEKVVEAWKSQAPAPAETRSDLKRTIADSRKEE